jgi:hypothetical protein
MIIDKLIIETGSPISMSFQGCKLYGYDGVFIGQHKDGKPNGFIKFINEYGGLYEGQANKDGFNGFGRYTNGFGYCYVGWWKNDKLHGNSRTYSNGVLELEGWYEKSKRKGPYNYETQDYKYWDENAYYLNQSGQEQ